MKSTNQDSLSIREATDRDFAEIWPIFREIVAAGDTYGFRPDTNMEQAQKLWMEAPRMTFVVEVQGRIRGSYFIKSNVEGPGDHVCNCGYMVSSAARGRGLASAMCEHSQTIARELGYRAMQFNFVAATNEGAVRLWRKHGFDIVGTLPDAFHHPSGRYVDAFVMYKRL